MANWSNPTLTSTYTNFLAEVKARDDDAATQFSVGTPTNMPTGAIKWDTSLNRWQKWSGSAWGELATTYNLTNIKANGTFEVTGNTTLGDSSADSVTVNAATVSFANATTIAGALSFSGAVGFTGNVTLGDASGDSVTVNAATMSIPNGLAVSGGTANFSALQVGGANVLTAASTATLTNKTFDTSGTGNAFKVNGNSLVGLAGTGTITFPAATGQVVLRDTTDTLTNKTLTSPVLNSPTINSPTFGAAIAIAQGGTGAVTAIAALAALGIDVSTISSNYLLIGGTGGFLIQWGQSASVSVNSSVSVVFPIDFPTFCAVVLPGSLFAAGTAGECGVAQVSAKNTHGATFETFRTFGSGSDSCYAQYIAIGW